MNVRAKQRLFNASQNRPFSEQMKLTKICVETNPF
jgi:hypothetical protein